MTKKFVSEGHFFVSSMATWRTGTDPEALIKAMKREGLNFSLWYVPAPAKTGYEIKWFAPQVEGSICLATWMEEKEKEAA